ncbi:LysR family transcriptional regulator [uncultured Pseudoalteromonas sp.]|uniref:LysR family transcriptional regulator n=1 Tax=uncultured Pseudoalteromonas sp. TaxID=114053 RepID=UPI002596215C|nr:LysR family transcriptional regulator [uncultured Pseudoalteromonas sp.]
MNGTMFNQLVIFHAIVRENSISKAAKRLEMTSPSVSNALKLLEAELELPLFTRTTRRIELTEAGRLLHESTLTSIHDLAYAFDGVSELAKEPSGKVRITMPRFVYQQYIKPIYAEFCRTYPKIELEISVNDATVNILNEGFDVGIRFGDRISPEMVARQLTKPMREVLFISKKYAKEFGIPRTANDLENHKQIQYRFIASNQALPFQLISNNEQVIVDIPKALIVNDTDLMLDAAIQGLGIGRLADCMVQDKIDSGEVIPILEQYWVPIAPIYIYFHQNTQKAKRVRVLIDFILEKIPYSLK